MEKLSSRSQPSNEDKEQLYQRMVDLWKRMRFYPKYDMNGDIIGGETIIADVVENLADKSKNELPPAT